LIFGFYFIQRADVHEAELAMLLNLHVYDNCGFRSALGVNSFRIEYINAPRRMVSEKKRENPDEAKSIHAYIGRHLDEDVAVLTPYRNQLHLLERLCTDLKHKDCILTVHGSQRREWDAVLLSVCDTSDMYFTNIQNKSSNGKLVMNTAVSRAKKRLILVCDYIYWISQNTQMICALLKNASPVK
jgi:superfamily I DNA/RNA helicase